MHQGTMFSDKAKKIYEHAHVRTSTGFARVLHTLVPSVWGTVVSRRVVSQSCTSMWRNSEVKAPRYAMVPAATMESPTTLVYAIDSDATDFIHLQGSNEQ